MLFKMVDMLTFKMIIYRCLARQDYLQMSSKTKQEKRSGMTAAFAAGTPELPSFANV